MSQITGPFRTEKVWRWLCSGWTILFIVFVLFDFFSFNAFEQLMLPLSAIYAAVLTLYVGTKEFDRWYEIHDGRHPGELFIAAWTAVIVIIVGTTFITGDRRYTLEPEVVADYIMVLSIFAVTQKSKQLHRRRPKR